jgi:protease I
MSEKRKVALLVEADYQDLEVWYPLLRLREEGYAAIPVGTGTSPTYRGKYGYPITVEAPITAVRAADFAGVVIPGGWAPDRLRMSDAVLAFVRDVNAAGKVVAAICHAGWVLASADIVKGKRLTSFRAIRDDLVHAGALWTDEEVIVDGNLVTSRTPDDLPAFMRATLRLLKEGAG